MAELRPLCSVHAVVGARRAARACATVLPALWLVACRSPTEVTLELSTNACDAGYVGTSITVVSATTLASLADGATPPAAAETSVCGPDGGIGSLVIIPGASGDGPFLVKVTTGLRGVTADQCALPNPPSTCIVATRELSLIDHTPLTLPIELLLNCEGVVCPAGTTCVNGQCPSDQLSGTTCTSPTGCDLNTVDAASVADATFTLDAGAADTGSGDGPADSSVPDAGAPDVAVAADAGPDAVPDATTADGGSPLDATVDAPAHADATPDAPIACTGQILCGGTCAASCTTTLAAGQASPWGIAVANGHVYWTNGCSGGTCVATGTVLSVAVGGGAVTTLATNQDGPWAVAADATNVYWTDSASCAPPACTGSVVKVPVGGGTTATIALAQDNPLGIALATTEVFWVDRYTGSNTAATGSVLGWKVSGASTTLTSLATAQAFPGGVATDGTYVYWTDYGPVANPLGSAGTVQRIAIAGPAVPTLVASAQDYISNVAVSGADVYWVTQGKTLSTPGGTVVKAPAAGGTPITLATGQGSLNNLATDGTYVYWANPAAGTVVKTLAAGGGAIVTLATAQANPSNVAIDSTSVYWTNGGSGAVGVADGDVMRFQPR